MDELTKDTMGVGDYIKVPESPKESVTGDMNFTFKHDFIDIPSPYPNSKPLEFDEVIQKLGKIANDNGIDCLASLATWLPGILKEHAEMTTRIEEAKNCLVCLAIGDPVEICNNTFDILQGKSDGS